MEKASHCIRPLRTAGSIIKYAKSHMHFYPVCLFFRHCNGKLAFGGFWCAVFCSATRISVCCPKAGKAGQDRGMVMQLWERDF